MPLSDIALGNLNDQTIIKLVTGILYGNRHGNDKNRVVKLRDILHQHTDGNAFFILHYLNYLSNIGLLTTDNDGVSWEWSLLSIVTQSCVPRSITDLLSQVIDNQPMLVSSSLLICSSKMP